MKSNLRTITISCLLCAVLIASACGPGKPGIPGGGSSSFQSISAGVITSLTAVQSTLQSLVNAGKTGFQSELTAINQVLDSAKQINTDIQTGAFSGTTDQKITALAGLASSLAVQFGASSNLVLAINIGVGLFESIRNAFKPSPTGQAKAPVDYSARKAELDARVKAYKAELKARSK